MARRWFEPEWKLTAFESIFPALLGLTQQTVEKEHFDQWHERGRKYISKCQQNYIIYGEKLPTMVRTLPPMPSHSSHLRFPRRRHPPIHNFIFLAPRKLSPVVVCRHLYPVSIGSVLSALISNPLPMKLALWKSHEIFICEKIYFQEAEARPFSNFLYRHFCDFVSLPR